MVCLHFLLHSVPWFNFYVNVVSAKFSYPALGPDFPNSLWTSLSGYVCSKLNTLQTQHIFFLSKSCFCTPYVNGITIFHTEETETLPPHPSTQAIIIPSQLHSCNGPQLCLCLLPLTMPWLFSLSSHLRATVVVELSP